MQNESDKPLTSKKTVENETENVAKFLEKEPLYGGYVDLKQFQIPDDAVRVDRLTDLDSMVQKSLNSVGITPDGQNKSGNFLMYNNKVSHHSSVVDGLELMPIKEAFKKHDWLEDYFWKLVDPKTDKYTAKSYLEDSDGYFIRVLPNVDAGEPVQSCLMIGTEKSIQTVHNIIIVEEGATLEIITGCVTHDNVKRALHVGVTEIYIKKGGKLTFSMIHDWDEAVEVRPRTAARVEENGQLINNYVCLKPAHTIQANPAAYLEGEGASAYFNTIAVAHPGALLDLGSRVFLNAQNTKTEILSRTLTLGGEVISRGDIIANAPNVYGHLECNGLVMNENGKQKAIPILEANALDVEMTHEASIGRIARDQVEYLMTRGLSEGEATGLIVRGFLSSGIEGIPDSLKEEIADIVKKTENAS